MSLRAARLAFLVAFAYLAGAAALRASNAATALTKSTLHLECASACTFVVAMCLGSCKTRRMNFAALVVPSLTAIPFLITLNVPFLSDSYSHLVSASRQSFRDVLRTAYVHPARGDFFFRPLGYLDYWIEYKWARFSSTLWHASSLSLHLLSTYLLFALCRNLRASLWGSSFAALSFGLHGTNVEVVAWIAGRFDDLVVCFVLVTLLLLSRSAHELKFSPWMLVTCALALLSKEAAFCLPALAVCCLWYQGTLNRKSLKPVVAFTAVCLVLFSYRFWVVGGIGGYRDAAGAPIILHFAFVRVIEVICLRLWAVLLFPINLSVSSQLWLTVAWLLLVLSASATLLVSKPNLRMVLASVGFAIAAVIPVIPLAALDTRIGGSRVYHLSLIGLALLIAAFYDGIPSKPLSALLITGFLIFQCTALIHNLLIWRDAALLAGRTCSTFARMVIDNKPVFVKNLPVTYNGAFFLANGFPDCVYVNSGKKVSINESGVPVAADHVFTWDAASNSIRSVP